MHIVRGCYRLQGVRLGKTGSKNTPIPPKTEGQTKKSPAVGEAGWGRARVNDSLTMASSMTFCFVSISPKTQLIFK